MLPKAHGGCRCVCHRREGVKHCIPCCRPTKDPTMHENYGVRKGNG